MKLKALQWIQPRLNILAWAIVAVGIIFRVIVFVQNRDLIMDEVSLVRNLHERSYLELLKPLSYEQYAPPLFLFVGKLNMTVFGSYEWAFRLFPLLSGIISLVLFYLLLRRLGVISAAFYPLFLIATGLIYVRYGTEFKQYSSDMLVSVSLLLLALKFHPVITKPVKLFSLWFFAGGIAIWLSMPSVFILAGIGLYFLNECWKSSEKKKVFPVILIAVVWLVQFLVYYFLLLKPSISSNYLQNWHKGYFLSVDSLSNLFGVMGGHWALSFVVNLLFLILGFYRLFRINKSLALLFAVPVLLLLLAAALHQFSLLPRVSLFIYPLLLAVIGSGFEYCLGMKYAKFTAMPLLICCLITMVNFNSLKWTIKPLKFEWYTDNLKWIEDKKGPSDNVYMHEFVRPQWIYYTTIHPDSMRWAGFKNASTFYWYTNMDSLCGHITQKSAFIFSWMDAGEINNDRLAFNKYFTTLDSIVAGPDRYAFIFLPKNLKAP